MAKKEKLTEAGTLDKVLTHFKEAWQAKQGKDELFREVYRRYRGYLEVSQSNSRSTLFIPESFTLVETVAPRMTARKPTFKAIPRTSADITKADKVGKLLDHRWDVMDLQHKIKLFAKQGLIYGTSVLKVGWDPTNSRPVADPIDIADVFPCPKTTSWQQGYIIHRYYRSVEDLKASPIKYKNLDKLEMREHTQARDDQMRQDREAIQNIPYDGKREGIEILEEWCLKDGEIYVYTVADRSVCIREDKSNLPLKEFPFIVFFDQEVPFEKWGIGEIEPILDLQDEENTTRNQRIDEKNLAIHNMWVVSKTAGVDYRTIVSKPGGIILANDINGIKPLEKQNITQDSLEELRLIKDDIRNVSGVNDFVRGADTGSTTATETAVKTQEANQRFAEKINNLEMAIRQLGRWILALDAAFLTDEIRINIEGKYGLKEETISLEEIQEEYDVDMETGSSLPSNPDLRRQQLRELTQVLVPILTNPNGIPDGLRELIRSLIQSYDLKNADEILQGAQHPEVSRVMAQLDQNELQGVNPQMVEAEIKRNLTGAGTFSPMAQAAVTGSQTEETPEQPPMRGANLPQVPTL